MKKNSAAFRRTKILATVGPATHSPEMIDAMMEAGVNAYRLNFSHGTLDERDLQLKWIRQAAIKHNTVVAIVQDIQGPKVRLGDFDGIINVKTGEILRFAYKADYEKTGVIPTQYDLSKKVKHGERLYLYDGKIRTTILSVGRDAVVHARAENDGILIKRKGMNLPDTDFQGEILTKKDQEDLAYGVKNDFDYVAISFVQTAKDVTRIKALLQNLGSTAKVISKIETKAAVDNIEEIVVASDAIMVARGDLAVETALEIVPSVQQHIVGLGLRYAKPTIIATQMLASMSEIPEPTRAEVSDIALAVLMGADCVMLSDETAMGRYPIEAIKVMRQVINYNESHRSIHIMFDDLENELLLTDKSQANGQRAIAAGVISLAETIHAQAIVPETITGNTVLQIISRRPNIPIFAETTEMRTAQQLALVYDVRCFVRPVDPKAAAKLTDWLQEQKVFYKGDIIVTTSGSAVAGATDTIKVRTLE